MTDKQLFAKDWLTYLEDLAEKLKAERRTLEFLQNRLCSGVSKYDSFAGRSDLIVSQAAHDDAQISISMQRERIEKAQRNYISRLETTRKVLEQIPPRMQAIAIDRYINGIKWEKLETLHNYSKSQLFNINRKILNCVADILSANKTNLTTSAKQEATA